MKEYLSDLRARFPGKEDLREWVPVRQHTDAHYRMYQSGNAMIFCSIGGDIFRFHLAIGPFSVSWDGGED